jgi:hypothetical protein
MQRSILALLLAAFAFPAAAMDDRVVTAKVPFDGEPMRYVLTSEGTAPKYAVLLMPGGAGRINLPEQDQPVGIKLHDNFLIRSRTLFADARVVAASFALTDAPRKIMAYVADLEQRFGKLKVYVVGTSASTVATMALARPLDGQVAGFVHTSSMNAISGFDTRGLKSRHLIVAHHADACRYSRPTSGQANASKYGTDLILIDGGKSIGDECEPWAAHGYYKVEQETVDRIKAWILAGP